VGRLEHSGHWAGLVVGCSWITRSWTIGSLGAKFGLDASRRVGCLLLCWNSWIFEESRPAYF
jgi:hypothetical protein